MRSLRLPFSARQLVYGLLVVVRECFSAALDQHAGEAHAGYSSENTLSVHHSLHHRRFHGRLQLHDIEVTRCEHVELLSENQSTYIPIGEKHRLANPGKIPAFLIEVQLGPYLDEGDIVRYKDIYGRT